MTAASGKFLLDTNIVIALFRGDDLILSNLAQAREVFISAVVLGELYFGAAKSTQASENILKVDRFAAGRTILPCDRQVAREYGYLKQHLKQKGRPLPENDIWIAAAARCHGIVLVTRDQHFKEIDKLQLTDWAAYPD